MRSDETSDAAVARPSNRDASFRSAQPIGHPPLTAGKHERQRPGPMTGCKIRRVTRKVEIEALGGSGKGFLLSDFASYGASVRPISDPIGAELDVYRATTDELEEEIRRLMDRIMAERSSGTT